MSLADRYAEFIYRIATTKNKLKIIMTPVGIILWFGLSALLVFASLWLDKLLPVYLPFSPLINLFLSALLLVIGAILALWAVCTFITVRGSPVPFNPPKEFITTGIYSQIRNPMLLGWFLMLFSLGILLSSISLIFIFTPIFILLNILYIKTIEEKEMEKKFGEQYLKYRKSVPMFIPRFGRRKTRDGI